MTTGFNNTNLDFESYKQSLKEFMQNQSQFKDYDFDGPNLAVLLDVLTYNTYHNALYLNMVGSEMFLDSAKMRDTIVSHAKELNYVPRSRTSSSVYVDMFATPSDSPGTITVPRFFSINGTNPDGQTYTFTTNEPIILSRANNYAVSSVVLYEGAIRSEAFRVTDSANTVLELRSDKLDTSSIVVEVRNSSSDSTSVSWNKTEDLFGLDGNSEVFFVQATSDFKYAITFGNGVVGKSLANGNIVVVSYRETAGENANFCERFLPVSSADGYSANTITLVSNTYSSGGAFAEDLESIRYNAVRGFTTQNRAVTADDFVSLLKSNFLSIQTAIAYGGEQGTPKRYGKVIVSAKPYSGEIVPDLLKDTIVSFLKSRCPMSIDPVFVDPEYLYLVIDSKVKYNVSATNKTAGQIKAAVNDAIGTFNITYLSVFGSDLRFSKLSSAIDLSDASIVSNDTKVKIAKRISPEPFTPFSANWSYENELYSENIRYALPAGHDPIVSSSAFVYRGYTSYIQDDGLGTLFVYSNINGSLTKINTAIGTVNYTTGEINISNLTVDSYVGEYIKIYARTENSDIDTLTNKILLIDNEDISTSIIGIRV